MVLVLLMYVFRCYGTLQYTHMCNYVSVKSLSPNPDLEPSKVYVIGGLVDHNHHKVLFRCSTNMMHSSFINFQL